MFGFFKKRASSDTTAALAEKIGKEAEIFLVFTKGIPSGFLITLNAELNSLQRQMSAESWSTLIASIEKRIGQGAFESPVVFDLSEEANFLTINKIARAMVDINHKVIGNWTSSIEQGRTVKSDKTNDAGKKINSRGIIRNFPLSTYLICIEWERDAVMEYWRLLARDELTNRLIFSYAWEKSPFLTCFTEEGADLRVNLGEAPLEMTEEQFETWAIPQAIQKIYGDDLMSLEQVNEFGIKVVSEHLGKVGVQLLTANANLQADPQIYALRNGKKLAILVRTAAFPQKGFLDRTGEDFYQFLINAMDEGYEISFASVGLANAIARNDYERRVLLKNGSFHVAFSELEDLE